MPLKHLVVSLLAVALICSSCGGQSSNVGSVNSQRQIADLQATIAALQTQLAQSPTPASGTAALVVTGTPAAPTAAPSPAISPSPDTVTPTRAPTPSPSPSPTPIPTPSPTATPQPPAGTILYQADWSNGFNGWAMGKGWKVLDGMLVNDGTGEGQLMPAPYLPADSGIANYDVEAEVHITRYNTGSYCKGRLGFVAREHYTAAIVSTCGLTAVIYRDGEGLGSQAFDPGNKWHTYRLQVQSSNIRFFIDDAPLVITTDTRFLSGGRVGFWCGETVECEVRSFKVIKE